MPLTLECEQSKLIGDDQIDDLMRLIRQTSGSVAQDKRDADINRAFRWINAQALAANDGDYRQLAALISEEGIKMIKGRIIGNNGEPLIALAISIAAIHPNGTNGHDPKAHLDK